MSMQGRRRPASDRRAALARATFLLATALGALLPGPAAAQDPALRSLQYATSHARAPLDIVDRPAAGFVSGGAVAIETRAGRTLVGVLVRLTSAATVDRLRALGAEIGGIAGDVASVRLPIEAVDALATLDGVIAAQAARVLLLEPQADVSMAVIGADGVRGHGATGWTGETGAGALVGVYDTGLDFRHPDFIAADGQTRVVEAWDQTALSGSPPIGFGYGHVCDRAAIQRAIDEDPLVCPMRDINGHGTHVAGTAAGNGSANRAFDLAGVAPEAELLIVKGGNGSFSEAGIVDGLVWLRDRAQALGRPVVVNLSLSGQAGPHDGTRLFERAIDNLSGPGFIVVTVSSNDGENRNTVPASDPLYIHARAAAAPTTARFTFEVGSYLPVIECSFNSFFLTAWAESADSVEIAVVRPDGTRATALVGELTVDSSDAGRIVIANAPDGFDPENGDAETFVLVDGCAGSAEPAVGEWAIEMTPRATVPSGQPMDLWLLTRFINNGLVIGLDGFDNRYVIGSPGTAHSAITVGAFVTRLCWPSIEPGRQVCYTQQEEVGDLARFSAAGPTRDGRQKPELTAPGLGIASALSRSASMSVLRLFRDDEHSVLEGTSMAAPHVTGAVALLLQHDPTLTPDGARALLSANAATDAFTARTYDASAAAQAVDWWGSGKLDACASVLAVLGEATSGLRIAPESDSLPQGARLPLHSCAADGAGTIAWQSSNPEVATVDAAGVVTAVATGNATIVAAAALARDSVRIAVVQPATLAFSTAAPPAIPPLRTRRDARLPLARLHVTSEGLEATDLVQVGVEVEGKDASAWIILADANDEGEYDTLPPFAAATQVTLDGTLVVPLRLEQTRRIEQRDTAHYVVLLQTSGAVPNGTRFSVRVDEGATETVGVRSGARNRVDASLASAPLAVESTLLPVGTALTFSENPVRRERVNFNFSGCPQRATVHTLTGVRVRDLGTLLICGEFGGSAEWDLTNDDGAHVAPGVYLVLFDIDGRAHREKLMVLRSNGNGQEE